MSSRWRNIAPYPQHMTGILGPIAKKSLKNLKKGPPLNPPMNVVVNSCLVNIVPDILVVKSTKKNLPYFLHL